MTQTHDTCRSVPKVGITPEALLATHNLFRHMTDEGKAAFKARARIQRFTRGNTIFLADDPAEWGYVIQGGWVKLFREALNGAEAIIDVLPPGSLFGETAPFENGSYSYGVEVIENVELIVFPLSILKDEAARNHDFSMAMIRHISGKGLAKDKETELRAIQNASQRIGCFLLRLCKDNESGAVTLTLPWEKALIAARLGMTPETFSRSLAKLQRDLDMTIKGPVVEIGDFEALVRYTCSACSNVFPCDN